MRADVVDLRERGSCRWKVIYFFFCMADIGLIGPRMFQTRKDTLTRRFFPDKHLRIHVRVLRRAHDLDKLIRAGFNMLQREIWYLN